MCTAIDVMELTKRVSENSGSYALGEDPTVYKLIPVHFESVKENKHSLVDILLKNDITCTFRIQSVEDYIRMNITFKSKELSPNLKYKASLYYFDWELKLTFLESIILENIEKDSIFHFSRPVKWFVDDKDCLRKILFNDHWFLYCEITQLTAIKVPRLMIQYPNSEMAQNFSMIYKTNLFTDVKIICNDKEFHAHKLILAARSSVFRAMFEHEIEESEYEPEPEPEPEESESIVMIDSTLFPEMNENEMNESGEDEIIINDFESEIVEHLLSFIYTDSVENLREEQAEKLLAAAYKYNLGNLKLICMRRMSESVQCIEEAIELLAIAGQYEVIGFKQVALDFIKNSASLVQNQSWADVVKNKNLQKSKKNDKTQS